MSELVSVIITTYKRRISVLKRAIDSAVRQSYKNIEIIVVNDYPEDVKLSQDIKILASSYPAKIKYVSYEANRGACAARNAGICESAGTYIALLDDDDEWLEKKIEVQMTGFVNRKTGIVYGPYYEIDNKIHGDVICESRKSGDLTDDLLWKNIVGGSSMPLVARKAYDTCGFFDEELPASQDYDMWLRIAQQYDAQFVNYPSTRRFLMSDSITQNYVKKKNGWILFMKKHEELYRKHPRQYNFRLAKMSGYCMEYRDFGYAMELLSKAVRIKAVSRFNITEPLKGLIKLCANYIEGERNDVENQ